MTDTHVVSALKAKRIELASQIEDYREKMRLSVIALDHVEANDRRECETGDGNARDLRAKEKPRGNRRASDKE